MEIFLAEQFGVLLKTYRKRIRLTQRQLARKLGVHYNTISAWERGNYLPEMKGTILELARLLRLNVQETRLLLEASLTALCPYWYLPYQRNPFFTGREMLLSQLHTLLHNQYGIASIRSCILYGLGGIGKTQTAIEYAYRYSDEYTATFWLSAETQESLVASFIAIAETLYLSEEQKQTESRIISAVIGWLNSHRDWLLIVDGIEELEQIRRYLPTPRRGSLLLTTRHQQLDTLAVAIQIPQMTMEESIRFLLYRSGLLEKHAMQEELYADDINAARSLATVIDGYPLALDQIGFDLQAMQWSLSSYYKLLCTKFILLLQERDIQSSHPYSVVKTVVLSFQHLQQRHSLAADLLTMCSFLAPDPIPEALIFRGMVQLETTIQTQMSDSWRFNAALKEILACSLILRYPQSQTVSIHRLVQAILKEQVAVDWQQTWIKRLVTWINQEFPSNAEDQRQSLWCEQLLPHALKVIAQSEEWGYFSPDLTSLLRKVATLSIT